MTPLSTDTNQQTQSNHFFSKNKVLQKALIISKIASGILLLAGLSLLCAGGITGMQPLMFAGAGAAGLGLIILIGATAVHRHCKRSRLLASRKQFFITLGKTNPRPLESGICRNSWMENQAYNILAKASVVYEETAGQSQEMPITLKRLTALKQLERLMGRSIRPFIRKRDIGHEEQGALLLALNTLYEIHRDDERTWIQDMFRDISFILQVCPVGDIHVLEFGCRAVKTTITCLNKEVMTRHIRDPSTFLLFFDFWHNPNHKSRQDKNSIQAYFNMLSQAGWRRESEDDDSRMIKWASLKMQDYSMHFHVSHFFKEGYASEIRACNYSDKDSDSESDWDWDK